MVQVAWGGRMMQRYSVLSRQAFPACRRQAFPLSPAVSNVNETHSSQDPLPHTHPWNCSKLLKPLVCFCTPRVIDIYRPVHYRNTEFVEILRLPFLCGMCFSGRPFLYGIHIFRKGFWVSSRGDVSIGTSSYDVIIPAAESWPMSVLFTSCAVLKLLVRF